MGEIEEEIEEILCDVKVFEKVGVFVVVFEFVFVDVVKFVMEEVLILIIGIGVGFYVDG